MGKFPFYAVAAMAALGTVGCGGDRGGQSATTVVNGTTLGPLSPYTFSTNNINCPNSTLTIGPASSFSSIGSTGTGATVIFTNLSTYAYYTNAGYLTSSGVVASLPSNAPLGTYDVSVNSVDIGTIQYTASDCGG